MTADVELLPPIERDEAMDRTYIPLPGGWEVQTKGKGSTFRICEPGDDPMRLAVPASPYLHDTLARMARDIHASVSHATAAQAAEIYDLGLRLDAAIDRSIESDRAESRLLDEIEALREQVSRLDEVNVELGRQLVEHEDRAERLAEALRFARTRFAPYMDDTDRAAFDAALHPTAAQEDGRE